MGPAQQPIRILLVDDHKIVRDGLRSLLEGQPDMKVIAEAQDGLEAVRMAKDINPDVIIMDIGMPNMNGIDATQHIMAANAAARIVGLSMHSDERFTQRMMQAGAYAYLRKDCAFDELARTIREAADPDPNRRNRPGDDSPESVPAGHVNNSAKSPHPQARAA